MTARPDARRLPRCGSSPLLALLVVLGACLACAATAAAAPIHRCATSPGQTICLEVPALQLSGKVTVSATVQSTADVWEVRFEWSGQPAEDGVHLFSDFEAPYTFTWPTAAFKDGSGTLSARVVKKDETPVGTPVAIPDPVVLANGNAVTPRNPSDWQALERSRPYEGDPVVAAVGDSGAGTARTDAVAAAVGASSASLLLYLGDLYEDGTPPELRDNFGRSAFDEPGSADAWGRLMPWTRPTTGNHEAHRPEDFRSWWHGRPDRYTFVHGGVRFIVLHSECNQIGGCGPGSVQYQFVQQTLADNDYACVVGVWHRPVLSAVEDNTTMRPIWKLLADGGGDLVLNGHSHNMQVYRPLDGDLVAGAPGSHMVELIGGAGGHALTATVETDPRAAWQRLKLSGAIYLTLVGGASGRASRIDWTFRDVNGQAMIGEGAFAGRSGAGSVSCGSAPAAPHATARPSIAGRAEEGRPLAALPGSWSGTGTPTFAYRWRRCDPVFGCKAIPGATEATYVPKPNDEGRRLDVVVTATDASGRASSSESRPSPPVQRRHLAPRVAGTLRIGAEATCVTEGWTSPRVSWLRGGRTIRGATLRTHRIAIADVGGLLACRATSTDPAGSLAETSVAVRVPLVRPLSVARPRVRGIARVGRRVRCELGTWRLARTYVVRWRRGARTIPRATARTYLLRSADRGRLIRCRVTARNAAGSLTISSVGRLVR